MKPTSPLERVVTLSHPLDDSPRSSNSAASLLDSLLDSPSRSGSDGASSPSSSALREPTVPKRRRTVSGVQAEVADALKEGADAQLRAALQQADDGHRLDAVLNGGKAGPTYALILDHLCADPGAKATHALVAQFGADLLHAVVWAGDLPHLAAACQLMGDRLPDLVAQHSARVFLAAAVSDPHVMHLLLQAVPSTHWGALLKVRGGEALTHLWRHAVAAAGTGAHQGVANLQRVLQETEPRLLRRLHAANLRVHSHMQESPALLVQLAEHLTAHGGVVPWGTP